MSTTHSTIDWNTVRERLARFQTQVDAPGNTDSDLLNREFRQRAQRLARRGRGEAIRTARAPIIVFRLGNERFGIELAHVKQVFPRMAIAPLPGMNGPLLGVANVNGSLRSVIDPGVLLNVPAMRSDAGFIVLLSASGKQLGIWVAIIEGVCHVDLDRLTAVNEAASDASGGLIKGTTDDRIVVLDAGSLIRRAADQCQQHSGATSAPTSRTLVLN